MESEGVGLGLQGKAGGLGPIPYGTSKLPTRANDPLQMIMIC